MKKTVSPSASKASHWAESRHKDIIIYLLVAIFLLELAVGGASAIYGIMHAEPVTPGGPPLPRFPWLGWGLSALLLPVGLLLILHLSGLLVARTLERPAGGEQGDDGQTSGQTSGQPSGQTAASSLPPHVERFYSIVRHAPTVVILLSLLIFGGLLLFVDGLVETLGRLGGAMMVYLPWIVGGLVIFLTVCYVTRQFFLYRHHQMEREYAFRQSVLERTGIILLPDGKTPLEIPPAALNALPAGEQSAAGPAGRPAIPAAGDPSDVSPARPSGPAAPGDEADDIVDADISPVAPADDGKTA